MDSISQIALGAAVGEAVAGAKAGRKAAVYGAIGGVIPDLDILLYPFLGEAARLAAHRGFSHSIFFALLAAPLFGWLLKKLHSRGQATFRDWTLLSFLALFSHALLDYFTLYGTQLLNPLSDHPFALGSIFIIDPLYTLPLIIGLFLAFSARRDPARRRRYNLAGIAVSCLYLAIGVGSKLGAEAQFKRSLQEQGIAYDRIYSTPTPFNSLLWIGMAEDRASDKLWVGLYSHLEESGPIHFRPVPKRTDLIASALDGPALRRLLWFSRGWFMVEPVDDRLVFHDLRFGRSDAWMTDDGRFIFSFRLFENPSARGQITGFARDYPELAATRENFARLGRRILGEKLERPRSVNGPVSEQETGHSQPARPPS